MKRQVTAGSEISGGRIAHSGPVFLFQVIDVTLESSAAVTLSMKRNILGV